jgi:hypothetical protein
VSRHLTKVKAAHLLVFNNRNYTLPFKYIISIKPPSKTEIITAIRELKKGKTPGIDNVVPEVLKIDPEETANIFEPLVKEIWEQEELPNGRTKGIIIKLPKKGDLTNCNNWRGITLLFSSSKILSRIILNRIKRRIDNKLRREQMGFREGRSCTDQVNTLRIILEQLNCIMRSCMVCTVRPVLLGDQSKGDEMGGACGAHGGGEGFIQHFGWEA